MPRQLVRIPITRLTGAHRIEPGYPKSYTPEQMRAWADDLNRLNHTSPEELQRLRTAPLDLLNDEQRARVAAYNMYYGDGESRLKGSLRDDGSVELENGSHRVAYMEDRSVDSVPVWVWANDTNRLERFRAECEAEREASPNERSARSQARQRQDRDTPERVEAERAR